MPNWTPAQIKVVLAKAQPLKQPAGRTSSGPRAGTVQSMSKTGYGKK